MSSIDVVDHVLKGEMEKRQMKSGLFPLSFAQQNTFVTYNMSGIQGISMCMIFLKTDVHLTLEFILHNTFL